MVTDDPNQSAYDDYCRRAVFVGCADISVTDATDRSDNCRPGMLFVAVPGTRVDGASFANEALALGATALMVEQPLAHVPVPQCVVRSTRHAFGQLCTALQADPSAHLSMAGVTGTNGKTTVSWLVRSILQTAGRQCGLLGTIEYHDGIKQVATGLTTPDTKAMNHWLAAMIDNGTQSAAIEISSHALDQQRIAGTLFDVAALTNVTQDHFDYHKTESNYQNAKRRIVEYLKPNGTLVWNADDQGCRAIVAQLDQSIPCTTFSLTTPADVQGQIESESLKNSRFTLTIGHESTVVTSHLIGRHNVSNCLAAAAICTNMGIGIAQIAHGLETLKCVPGRMEPIELGQAYRVFIDYAHTDDALRHAVQFLRNHTSGRLISVFGAGGDRDRSKRALLGQAGAESDMVVLTSDNPRNEEPQKIIDEIAVGVSGHDKSLQKIVDRDTAIRWALDNARPGDTVLIAGKGHETEQIIGNQRLPFSDFDVVTDVLSEQLCLACREPLRASA